jgi:hypothetical protein
MMRLLASRFRSSFSPSCKQTRSRGFGIIDPERFAFRTCLLGPLLLSVESGAGFGGPFLSAIFRLLTCSRFHFRFPLSITLFLFPSKSVSYRAAPPCSYPCRPVPAYPPGNGTPARVLFTPLSRDRPSAHATHLATSFEYGRDGRPYSSMPILSALKSPASPVQIPTS